MEQYMDERKQEVEKAKMERPLEMRETNGEWVVVSDQDARKYEIERAKEKA